MRVLLVVHGFPPTAMGGTEVYVHGLARALHDLGEEVFVLAREADPSRPEHALRREQLRPGLEVCFVNSTFRSCRSFADSYRNPPLRAVARSVVEQLRPDVAHVHHLTCLSTDILGDLARLGIPVVFTLHDYWLLCHRGQLLDLDLQLCPGPGEACQRCIGPAAGSPPLAFAGAAALRRLAPWVHRPLRRLAERAAGALPAGGVAHDRLAHMRRVARHVDIFLAPSKVVLERHAGTLLPRERLQLTSLGIDSAPFAGLRREPSPLLRVGYLGSMMVSKAPHLLLEAFSGLPPGRATVTILGGHAAYHGDASYRSLLEPLLALPGVEHRGSVPHDAVPRELARVDVLVVPSTWPETWSLVVREAFLAGAPVVAADIGALGEAVQHEVNGLLFPPGDVEALRRCLLRLLEEPGLLDRLRAGIPPVGTIAEDAMELRQLYRRLAAAPRPQPPRLRLTAVILNYRSARECVLALRSLASSRRRPDRVLVVDNGSGDGSEELLRRHFPDLEAISAGTNLGFSAGCNRGIQAALEDRADLVFLLNPDAMVAVDTLGTLEECLLEERTVGLAGPVVLARSDPSRIASAGISFSPKIGRMRHLDAGALADRVRIPARRTVAAAAGCALLVRREVFDAVGLLDEDLFFSFEEIELCLRAGRAALRTVVAGDAVAYHAGGASLDPCSPKRLYYAARNHLLVAQRAAPTRPLLAPWRSLFILGLNLAHALRGRGFPRAAGVAAVLGGAMDAWRGRTGPLG